jgi:hypothetical protein
LRILYPRICRNKAILKTGSDGYSPSVNVPSTSVINKAILFVVIIIFIRINLYQHSGVEVIVNIPLWLIGETVPHRRYYSKMIVV